MNEPNLDVSTRFLNANPPPGTLLLCGITGSHHYGFPSPDSDIDIKGIHIAPTVALLGLTTPADNHDRLEMFEGIECDLTTHEGRMAMSLLLKGNGNILERIFSPYQLVPGEHVQTLREMATRSLSKCSFHHYFGYFKGMQKEHRRAAPHAKSLLYTYRVALTGIHLLRTGVVQAHLPTLAPLYDLNDAFELMERKRTTAEKTVLTPAESEHYCAHWPRLESALRDALEDSELPAGPQNRQEIHDWLVARRLEQL